MNLVLTGFMGTGKSTIGRLVAARLSRPFIDMDEAIEQQAGQTIPEIFNSQGEAAFRRLESQVCAELAARDGLVIATGGGALVNPTNRALMEQSGLIICLTATSEALLERLAGNGNRPLLNKPNPAQEIARLLAARAAAYAVLPHHVDTTALDPEQVTEMIINLWHTQTSPP